jgi:hypothetical protein
MRNIERSMPRYSGWKKTYRVRPLPRRALAAAETRSGIYYYIIFQMSFICENCGEPALLICSRCKVAFYCAPECQSCDWSKHKGACVAAAGLGSAAAPRAAEASPAAVPGPPVSSSLGGSSAADEIDRSDFGPLTLEFLRDLESGKIRLDPPYDELGAPVAAEVDGDAVMPDAPTSPTSVAKREREEVFNPKNARARLDGSPEGSTSGSGSTFSQLGLNLNDGAAAPPARSAFSEAVAEAAQLAAGSDALARQQTTAPAEAAQSARLQSGAEVAARDEAAQLALIVPAAAVVAAQAVRSAPVGAQQQAEDTQLARHVGMEVDQAGALAAPSTASAIYAPQQQHQQQD